MTPAGGAPRAGRGRARTAPRLRRFASVLGVAGAGLVLSIVSLPEAHAHKVDAATITLTEVAAGRFLVRWQAGSAALQTDFESPAEFPPPCHLDGAYLDCGPRGLVGTIVFPWMQGTLTRVMVEIE